MFSLGARGHVSILPYVAVLPFRTVGGDAMDATVGDWLAEEMSRSLSRSRLVAMISHLSCRELAIGRPDTTRIRAALHADYCVAGTLHRSGANFVLDADFLDVPSGRILWTRQFSASVDTYFQTAAEGIAGLVGAVGAAIADEALAHVAGRQLADIEDHRLVVAGVRLMARPTLADLARSRQLIEEAIRRAPHAAEPHAWLAKWYVLSVFNGWSVDPRTDKQLGVDAAARALDLSPDNAFCLAIEGLVENNLNKRLDVAESRFKLALEANPSSALSHLLYGTLDAFRDKGAEAVASVDKARRLSPLDPFRYYYLGLSSAAYLANEQFDIALQLADESLQLHDRHVSSLRSKIIALHNLGETSALAQAGERLRRQDPDFTVAGYLATHPAADFEFGRRAARALRAAGIP